MTTVEIKEIKPDIPIINDTKDTPENIKNLVGKDNGLTNENEVIGDSLEKDKVVIKVSTPDELVGTVKVSIYKEVVFSISFALKHVTVLYIKTVMETNIHLGYKIQLDPINGFIFSEWYVSKATHIVEPRHEISNNVVCATSKDSDQPAHKRSLIRAFVSRLNILWLLSYWPNIIWSF